MKIYYYLLATATGWMLTFVIFEDDKIKIGHCWTFHSIFFYVFGLLHSDIFKLFTQFPLLFFCELLKTIFLTQYFVLFPLKYLTF